MSKGHLGFPDLPNFSNQFWIGNALPFLLLYQLFTPPRTATPRSAARIRCPATASGIGFRRSSRRAVECIMGRQQLRQILTPALFASEFLLPSYNQKFILLTTPLTTVLINRHIILLPKTEESDSSVRLFRCKFTNPLQKALYQISLS